MKWIAQHNQLLRFRSNGQPLERSQVPRRLHNALCASVPTRHSFTPSFRGATRHFLLTYTVSTPASPSCFVPGLPIHTTLQRTALNGSSSRTSSTTWPRLRRKSPWSRNPRCEVSTTRQGILFWSRSRLMTRLARFFVAIRLDRRPSGTEEGVGIFSPLEVVSMDAKSLLAKTRLPQPPREHVDQGRTAQQGQRDEYPQQHGKQQGKACYMRAAVTATWDIPQD